MSAEPGLAPGQRWISATEAELGLGIVESVDQRHVVLVFPATGERRTYARGNAPLGRVAYDAGERIRSADGESARVVARRGEQGRLVYEGETEDGRRVEIDEIDLDSFVQFSRPQDRLLAGRIEAPAAFDLRAETLAHRHRHEASPAFGLVGPRVELLAHQMYIAAQVGARTAPRVLLADEVGLGKTVEAGLVLHRLLLAGAATRVLIVVPESLLFQWLVEMLRRFNLRFAIVDQERIAAHEDDALDAFEGTQLCLCPLSLLAGHDDVTGAAVTAGWDVVVVDEAHRLAWSEADSSSEYRCVERLAACAPALLLLTATPEQLGVEGHFARLRLLDPARYADLARFRAEEAGYRAVGELVDALRGCDDGGLRALLGPVESALGARRAARLDAALEAGDTRSAIERTVRELLDLRGTGRVLFRNTRRAIGGMPGRRLHRHPLPCPRDWSALEHELGEPQLLAPELALGPAWLELDPRVGWLVDWLSANRREKALLICARGETAQSLEAHLRLRHGVRSCVFHEGMDLLARDRAAAYFSSPTEGARILLCSEIGSEGRNFQQARHLILFDLPADAELLEQRIGRLDRIGQHHVVEVHVPYYEGSLQHAMLRWYDEGLAALDAPFPAPARVASVLGPAPGACDAARAAPGGLDALVARTRTLRAEVLAELEAGRDRMLELSSFDAGAAARVVDAVRDAERADALAGYLERVLDEVGVEVEAHGDARLVIRPTARTVEAGLPGLPEDGLDATCDRHQALAFEDRQFLTWEHPLVLAAMGLVVDGGIGSAALGTLEVAALPSGTVLVETLFTAHCPAPHRLQIPRYLDRALVRHVVDGDGRDLASVLTPARMSERMRPVEAETAHAAVAHLRSELSRRLEVAEGLAAPELTRMVAAARARAGELLGSEVERLETLSAAGAGVDESELAQARADAREVDALLAGASLRLDALRVAVVL